MKITTTLLVLLVLFLPTTYPQDYTQMNLPEGAVARLGKGGIGKVLYAADGSRLAVVNSVGIWLYDTTTGQEVALLPGHTEWIDHIAISPDGKTLAAGGDWHKSVRLWNTETGEPKPALTGNTSGVGSIAFSPDGATFASGGWDETTRLWHTETWELKHTDVGTEAHPRREYGGNQRPIVQPGWKDACLLELERGGAAVGCCDG